MDRSLKRDQIFLATLEYIKTSTAPTEAREKAFLHCVETFRLLAETETETETGELKNESTS